MVSSFFKFFIRSLRAKRLYTTINLLGLGLSISVAMLLYLFIKHELSFDSFNQCSEQIYRIETNIDMSAISNSAWRVPALSNPLIEKIRSDIPGIYKSTRYLKDIRKNVVHASNKSFSDKLTYVDNDFFSMFSFELLVGDSQNALSDNSSVIISESLAKKYFEKTDPINQIIVVDQFNGQRNYIVRGVIKDPPSNSSISYELLAPIESYPYYPDYQLSWNEHNYSFFVLLSDGSNVSNFKKNLAKLAETTKALIVPNKDDGFELTTTSLTKIHWNTEIPWEKTSNFQNIKVLSLIAGIVVIMACFNFISLSLVNSTRRRVEVGIKKLVGANRSSLAFQFIIESIILTTVAALVSLVLVFLLLPLFNSITEIDQSIRFDLLDFAFFLSIILIVGVLAGSYPSFILSSFKPAEILKSYTVFKIKYSMVSILVFFQFLMSLFLGSSSLIMTRQMNHINKKDLGFDHEQLIALPVFSTGEEALRAIRNFKNATAYEPGILQVTASSNSPFEGLSSMGFTNKNGERKSSKAYAVDIDFIETLGLKLIQGRGFDPKNPADSNAVIVNEKLASEISNSPIGDTFTWGGSQSSEIIGIVKDFNFRSLEFSIDPLFLTINKNIIQPSVLLIKIDGKEVNKTLSRIEEIYKKTNPNKPFEFKFLSDAVQNQYKSYKMWTNIIQYSNLFTVFIACIGLFGLAGVEALNKYKEIGIRKVFGANSNQILLRISRRYMIIVLIASILSTITSHLVMSNWLSNFAFRINIDWKIYFSGILIGLTMLVVSIGYHTIIASRTNPAETLKTNG
jgi:putative ABC transport system permease protein